MTLMSLRREICAIGRRMWQRGYCAGNDGNISARVPRATHRILCTPTGISKGFMQPQMLTPVDPAGRQIGAGKYRPTSEILLHLAIYQKRPDVQAVVHSHAPHATAFACSGLQLPRGIYPEAEICLGHIPTVPYAKAGCEDLGACTAAYVDTHTKALLLGNHGTITFGKNLTDAYYRLEMLDSYCQILLALRQLGQTRRLTKNELRTLTPS